MIKKILLGTLIVLIVICAGGALFLYRAVNADVDEHFAGSCTEVPLNGSGEDIQIDRERGFAYLSMYDRLGVAQGIETEPGMVMRIDLNRTPYSAEPALTDGPQLHPHGLSIFIDAAGLRHLFVINHPEDRASGDEVMELYVETTPGVFAHQESFASPLITRANDMVAVGPRQFYVAQDVDRTSNVTLTDLVHFDGTRYTVVANDIESGGGINVSADYATLYIAETGGKAIRVAAREADGSVTTLERIALGSSPDNIDVAADQSLWVGAHSNVTALAMHFIMGSNAPSQILRVERNEEGSDIREIYLNAGEQISAGSGGTTYGNKLVIGSITARKVLVCEMD
jgi:hypothetical protein